MQLQSSWCRRPMLKCKCKVYPWWCQCTYLYHDANVLLGICRDANALMQTQFIQKFPLFSKSRLPQRLKNIFKSWFVIPRKVIFLFFFYLRLPKNWWSLLEISEWDIDLEFDDLAQQIYFHNLVQQKGGTFSRPFSGKMNSLKIKHLKNIHFF